jgi:hypothetical protein
MFTICEYFFHSFHRAGYELRFPLSNQERLIFTSIMASSITLFHDYNKIHKHTQVQNSSKDIFKYLTAVTKSFTTGYNNVTVGAERALLITFLPITPS